MKARAHKSKKGQYGADEQRLSGGLRLPKWLVVVIAIALVAGASYAACVFLLPGRIPPELVGQWRVVGGKLDGPTFEFSRDGTMISAFRTDGKELAMEGTAEVTDKTLRTTTTSPFTGKAETGTQTIVTLTETEFVTEDARGARVKMARVR